MIEYQVENWSDMIEEGLALSYPQRHWKEVAVNQDKVPLDLDLERYHQLESQKILHVVTVRDDGKLIGYHVSIISPHLHYKSTLHAMVDLYYLNPDYRRQGVGKGMFEFVEKKLVEIGVRKVYTGTKTHLSFRTLLESLGYKETEIMFTKVIGD